jgi:hypothetical protein
MDGRLVGTGGQLACCKYGTGWGTRLRIPVSFTIFPSMQSSNKFCLCSGLCLRFRKLMATADTGFESRLDPAQTIVFFFFSFFYLSSRKFSDLSRTPV